MAEDLEEARAEAEALLALHASGYAAHVFEDEERVATIRREARARETGADLQSIT